MAVSVFQATHVWMDTSCVTVDTFLRQVEWLTAKLTASARRASLNKMCEAAVGRYCVHTSRLIQTDARMYLS